MFINASATKWLAAAAFVLGEGNGNPLQCSCLENPRDGGTYWAAIYGVAQSWTRLKWLSSSCYKNHKATIFQQSHLPDRLKASTLRELTNCAAEAQSPSNELFGSNVCVNTFSTMNVRWAGKDQRKKEAQRNLEDSGFPQTSFLLCSFTYSRRFLQLLTSK